MSTAAGSEQGSGGRLFALEQALQLGHDQGINGGTVAEHLPHALAFVEAVQSVDPTPALLVDLGSGGGYPGLVVASFLPTTTVVLVEARQKRADYLSRSIYALGMEDRVSVHDGDASSLADSLRDAVDVVTARSFGSPALVAECAAPLLRTGGNAIVSEPPEGHWDDRWPFAELTKVGLTPQPLATTEGVRFAVLQKDGITPLTIPRARRAMERKPLY